MDHVWSGRLVHTGDCKVKLHVQEWTKGGNQNTVYKETVTNVQLASYNELYTSNLWPLDGEKCNLTLNWAHLLSDDFHNAL